MPLGMPRKTYPRKDKRLAVSFKKTSFSGLRLAGFAFRRVSRLAMTRMQTLGACGFEDVALRVELRTFTGFPSCK